MAKRMALAGAGRVLIRPQLLPGYPGTGRRPGSDPFLYEPSGEALESIFFNQQGRNRLVNASKR